MKKLPLNAFSLFCGFGKHTIIYKLTCGKLYSVPAASLNLRIMDSNVENEEKGKETPNNTGNHFFSFFPSFFLSSCLSVFHFFLPLVLSIFVFAVAMHIEMKCKTPTDNYVHCREFVLLDVHNKKKKLDGIFLSALSSMSSEIVISCDAKFIH